MRQNTQKSKHQVRMRCAAFLIFSFSHFLIFNVAAQSTFTQRIQQDTKGGAKLTVTHDKAIDDLVNKLKTGPTQSQQTDNNTTATNQNQKDKRATQHVIMERDSTDSTPVDNRRKVMRGGQKVNGYRVQAFAGGNSRKDRQQAEQVGNRIKARYPGEPVYVHFYSPRWICRVGNYRTYEEAHQMLVNIRNLGISGASIVKGKITVSSTPSSN